ncbi:MAG TPA: nucleotide sugar dehydrogenase [Kineosporiaceae bacterium]
MKIAVFGLGYVGTVTAAGMASRGHQVWGVDVDAMKIELLRSGRSPVVEPAIDELVAQGVGDGSLRVTTEAAEAIEGADVSLLCVGTPSTARGDTDLSYLRRALADIKGAMATTAPPASGRHAVVVRSTVPPGTGSQVVAPQFVDCSPAGWHVGTAMCPEFLREGSSVADFFDPPLVVVGSDETWVGDLTAEVFAFLECQVRHVSVRSAEALKYACNAFHATKVSFANEMGRLFRAHGIDSREVMEVFSADQVLNISPAYLRPGFAFGGSCLPKDLRALLHLARVSSLDVPLLSGVLRTNELVIRDVVDRLVAGPSREVALLGLSFKAGTDDLRESPNVELAEQLLGKGFDLRIYDPIVHPDRLIGANLRHIEARLPHLRRLLYSTPRAAMTGAGTAVVATSDAAVVRDLCTAPPQRIVDLNGRLGGAVEALPGYEGIGWAK